MKSAWKNMMPKKPVNNSFSQYCKNYNLISKPYSNS